MMTVDSQARKVTRHSHGCVLHEHPYGDIPHDHEENEFRERGMFWYLWPVFLLVDTLCALAFAVTGESAAECSNALVGGLAGSACQDYMTAHEFGIAGMLVFSALLVAALLGGRKS